MDGEEAGALNCGQVVDHGAGVLPLVRRLHLHDDQQLVVRREEMSLCRNQLSVVLGPDEARSEGQADCIIPEMEGKWTF